MKENIEKKISPDRIYSYSFVLEDGRARLK